jgi:hypothetical protein
MGIFEDIAGNNVRRSTVDDFQEKVKILEEYYENLVKHLNETALKSTPCISFAKPDQSQLSNLAGKIDSVKFFQNEFEKMFPEQIRSAWEVIVSLINGETQKHVTGLTQLGKNGLITVILDFLGIVAYAHEKNKSENECPKFLAPVAWLPNAINMESQSIEKFGQSMLLNGIIKCHIGKEVFVLKDYHKAVAEKLQLAIIQTIGSSQETNTDKTKSKNQVASFFSTNSTALVLRRSTAKSKFYRWLFAGAKTKMKIVLVMDESHIAIGKNQGADKILRDGVINVGGTIPTGLKTQDPEPQVMVDEYEEEFDAEQDSAEEEFDAEQDSAEEEFDAEQDSVEEEQELKKEIAETTEILNTYKAIFEGEAKLITVSATNTAFLVNGWKEGDEPVYLEVASGYCGFMFVDGRDYPLNTGVVTAEPLVKPIKEIAKEFKLPDLELLN